MNTLTLLSLLITVSVSLSNVDHCHGGGDGGGHPSDGGFTVDLIHRDSPLSPLYNPTYGRSERIQNAFLRSVSRASRILKRAYVSAIDANISAITGEYIMRIGIGNPPVEVVGIADTGSDITWAQCQPCKNCYKQGALPFLKPNASSTYHVESCQSKACEALGNDRLACSAENVCKYGLRYGDGSYTNGDLGNDTFWIGSTPLKNVVFGCGHDTNGTFTEEASGIIGLGGGPLSIINQLKDTIQGKFSYCLVSALTKRSNATGKIHFGDHAVVSGPDVVSTPLKRNIPATYYYVVLEHVSVGKIKLPYKVNTTFMKKMGLDTENIIIDSGTTLTIVAQEFHDDLTAALSRVIGDETVPDPQGMFDFCYKDLDLSRVPTITFGFTGADVEFPRENVFIEVQKGVSCLTIVPSVGVGIIGNLLQQNLLVGFDLVNNKVSFRPTDCRNHN
ncbi:aspartic proteinase CDR1-like [Cynara cardunculus var. scolymus]|uniref:Aspartic peptidase n=1 Tax=Cynara cardunculus var. scolymus TaxID=59895 RepID=A0A103XZE3_CYNCS|nr:aspartic proteinase CDR1-like [Cynara cardunculus var. scolymus]KVH99688.1 Aspartic peptidase [Cynara cardunculus var. scolymus]